MAAKVMPMKALPRELDPAQVGELLDEVRHLRHLSERMRFLSWSFLGRAYIIDPLMGSLNDPEVFTVSLAGFDCVTYIETVLALARSQSTTRFVEEIRCIRYRDGQVDWLNRNHYMTQWIRNNARRGVVRDITRGRDTITKTRRLSTLEGYPPKTVTVRCFPKGHIHRFKHKIWDGDLIFFVSTRSRLDTFHTGLVVWDKDCVILRHASRSQGKVIEQELDGFLKQNRMSGFIVVRPTRDRTAHAGA